MWEETESSLPALPEGFFWRVKRDMWTGKAMIHLMKETDLYLFKITRSLDSKVIHGKSAWTLVDAAERLYHQNDHRLDDSMFGDYLRGKK